MMRSHVALLFAFFTILLFADYITACKLPADAGTPLKRSKRQLWDWLKKKASDTWEGTKRAIKQGWQTHLRMTETREYQRMQQLNRPGI